MFKKVDRKVLKFQTDRINEAIKYLKSKSITETNNIIRGASDWVSNWIGLKEAQYRNKNEPSWKHKVERVAKKLRKEVDFLERQVNPSCPRKGGGGAHWQGQSPDRWELTDKAMNLKFYDFLSNFIWNKGPTKKKLSVKYVLRTRPFVEDGWNSSVIGDVPTRSWFL